MGVLSNIFKPRDKPENRTTGSAYTFYMGGTISSKAVTECSAMQMTAAWKKPSTIHWRMTYPVHKPQWSELMSYTSSKIIHLR